jgi:VWFA-related protein
VGILTPARWPWLAVAANATLSLFSVEDAPHRTKCSQLRVCSRNSRCPTAVNRYTRARRLFAEWVISDAAAIALLAALAQAPTFSSRVDAVRVDVLVTDNGKPVIGLTQSDFQILDNGVAQPVDLVSFDQVPLNVVLAFDMSNSVDGDRRDQLLDGVDNLLASLQRDDQAGLVTFSHVVNRGAKLTGDLAAVREALARAQGIGDTALVDGVFAAMMVGESDVGRGLLIIFSDGVDTSSWLPSAVVLDTARRSGVVAYAVSVKSRVRPEFLEQLTALTGGRLFEVERTQNLDTIFLGVLDEFRHRYLVSYTPRNVPRTGWHQLEVRVKGRRATVKARPGYLAGY